MKKAYSTRMNMSLTPISREEMRTMKAKADEEMRANFIEKIVLEIYHPARRQAKTTHETSYRYSLSNTTYHNHGQHTSRALKANIPDILRRLRELFPGCTVTHTAVAKGQDGQLHDMSSMEEKVLAFVNRQTTEEYIVIDWS